MGLEAACVGDAISGMVCLYMVCSQSCLHVAFPSGPTKPTRLARIGSGCGVCTRPEGYAGHQCRRKGNQSQSPQALEPPQGAIPLQPQDTRGSPGGAQQLQGRGGGAGYLGRQHGWTLPLTGAPSCSRPIGVGVFTGSNDKLGFLWALAIYLLWGGFPLARLLCDQRSKF